MTPDERVKILVVDDLPERLLVYEAILRDLGQELVLARSGDEALRAVLQDEFAVILLDVNMPGIDGFETANLIRRRQKSSHTPIIFVTAFTDEVRMAEGYSHGAVDFISTPIVPAILRAKINVFVDLFRMTQQARRHAAQEIALAAERSQRAAAEEANRRLSYLVRAGAIIARSLDRRITAENILKLLVPEQADEAALAIRERDDWKVMVIRAGATPAEVVEEEFSELPEEWREAIQQVCMPEARMALAVDQSGAVRLPHLAGLPLSDRERVIGVLLAARRGGSMPFSQADSQVLESIASRSSAALVKARLYEEIEFANQQKNRFLSMLAHELRNPLAPIQSAVDLMRLSEIEDADVTAARDVIARQVAHLVRLVDDLLDVSRITLGKIRLNLERIDATQVVPDAVEISRPLIDVGGHQLSVSVPKGPLTIAGDRARLAQVLSNLLNNAAKYTPPGGSIALSVHEENGEVVFGVRDSGVGIPAPMLSKVFDLFTQVENSLDRSQGGLGIGLTLVREVVELHGGNVEVTSAGTGQGCEFKVRIPRAQGEPHGSGCSRAGADESRLELQGAATGCSPVA
ncbi:MAG: hybrid sensor histidine kinase/response regulator [Planctomycetaceae bacterium]|nr:hybrid sensor histidine kinase/response regulator [Planctomycetaceae bacterium]